MKSIICALLLLPVTLQGQLTRQDSIWLPLKTLIGTWEGTGGGQPGMGRYERSYSFVLNKKYIEVRNRSEYPPTEKNPDGERHEDLGYISFDRLRHTFVLRQFHIEGFVNQYFLDSVSADGKTMFFLSEALENSPRGWRASETYHFHSDTEFTETFQLAAPGQPFETYTRATLKRKQ